MSPHDVLAFWFGAPPGRPGYGRPRALWFEKSDAFDENVRARLGPAHEAAAERRYDAWRASARGALALVILLDQVPRNIFRGEPRSYATDDKAVAIASAAVARGGDRALLPAERMFLYMPFLHSERIADQRRALALFAQIAKFTETAGALESAQHHHDIIARFGRFPHRNAILGRAATPEEAAYLSESNAIF